MVGEWDLDPGWWGGQADIERAVAFAGHLPACMLPDFDDCSGCPLESASPCPVKVDPDYRSYLRYLRDRHIAYEQKRVDQLKVLSKILKRYKLSMHWENLAILALREAPGLFTSAHSIKALVHFNTDIFCIGSDGVVALAQ